VAIVSFGESATEDFFHGVDSAKSRRVAQGCDGVARRKLDMVNAAAALEDLRVPPGNRLEALKGALAGYHSIRVNQQWRVVFRWDNGAHDVRIEDYH
jgi:proteic killer suppression protein